MRRSVNGAAYGARSCGRWRTPSRRYRQNRGFSFLEVLLSLGSFGMGFAALLSLSSVVSQRNRLSLEVSAATLIAQSRMEALKLVGYDGLTDTGPIDGSAGPLDAQGKSSASGQYSVTWDVQDDVPEANARTVVVRVAWTSATLKPRDVTLQTVLTDVAP